jgi:hypothetical protein
VLSSLSEANQIHGVNARPEQQSFHYTPQKKIIVPGKLLSNLPLSERLFDERGRYASHPLLRRAQMKYLCLVFFDEKKHDALSQQEVRELTDQALEYDDFLQRGGHFITANALEPVHAASTVRVRNGKVSVTDGPFAETNEQIGGFILIEAKDLNEAIQLASGIPPIRLGGIEIRPIKEITHSNTKRPE